jgi:hypothetical protein
VIFSIQTYLEDYFNQIGLADKDRYAVNLASLYDRKRHFESEGKFLSAMKRMRTTFYKRNSSISRVSFEKQLLKVLDSKFKKKDFIPSPKRSSRELKLQVSV